MKKSIVDIIILVHSEPEITEKCFKKLFEHTDEKTFRLIIVDNGADVATKKVMKKYIREQDEYIQMFKNVGFAKGVNKGLEEVKAPYFCLLNNDVLATPDWLKKMLKKLKRIPKAGAIGAISNFASGKQLLVPEDRDKEITDENYESFEPTLDPLLIFGPERKVEKVCSNKFETYWKTPIIAFFAALFKSEVLKKVGVLDDQFSPAYSEDWDYSFRMQREGYDLLIDRETFLYHYGEITARGVLKQDKQSQYQISHQKLIDKWGQKFVDKKLATDRDIRRLDPQSVTVAVPNTGSVSHHFLFNFASLLRPRNTVLDDLPRMVVHFARNEAVKKALANGTNYIFFLDSDTKFPVDILTRFLKFDKDLVGAVVTKRVPPYNPCVYKGRKKMKSVNKVGWTWLSKAGVGLLEIDGIGMAATLINMKVLKNMRQPWFYFPKYIGEDLHFCERAQDAGFKLFCDTDVACLHEGEIQFHGWDDFTKWAKEHGGTVIQGSDEGDLAKKVKEYQDRGGEITNVKDSTN